MYLNILLHWKFTCKLKHFADYPIIRGSICFDCQQTRDPRLCRSVAVCMEGEVRLNKVHISKLEIILKQKQYICTVYNQCARDISKSCNVLVVRKITALLLKVC